MAFRSYSKWALVAIIGGVALTAIEVYGAVSFLVSQAMPNYLVAGGAVVTLVAAVLPILAPRAWASGRYVLASLLWLALIPALSVIVCAAVERTGSANDQANRDRQAVAQKIALAREAVADAKSEVEAAEAKAADECSRSLKGSNPRGPKCLAAEERADKSRQRLQAARDALAQAGVVPKDPMAIRIAAVLPVSVEAVQLYQPLILPLSISGLGLLLIACGAHHPKRRKAKRVKGKRKRRKAKPKAKPLPEPLPRNVVRLPRRK